MKLVKNTEQEGLFYSRGWKFPFWERILNRWSLEGQAALPVVVGWDRAIPEPCVLRGPGSS
jgi:hypothetical protein